MAPGITIGTVDILPMVDSHIGASASFMFPDVAEELWVPWREQHPESFNARGDLNLNVGTFVVRSAGQTIVIDTGYGDKPREGYPPGALLNNLQEAGIALDDVDLVICTHLHIDHVGWNTVQRDGEYVPTFPRARYLFTQAEWDYWTQPEQVAANECIRDSVLPLDGTGQLDLVDDQYNVTEELTLVPSPGHTPGHVSIAIVSGAERGIIIGDIAHHPAQLTETEWSVMFDIDPALGVKSRQAIIERIERDDAVVIGGHFPPPGIGRLIRLGDRRVYRGADIE